MSWTRPTSKWTRSYDAQEGGFGDCAEISASGHTQFSPPVLRARSEQPSAANTPSRWIFSPSEKWRPAECTIIWAADFIVTRSIVTGTCRILKRCFTIRRNWPLPISRLFRSRATHFAAVARDILDYVRSRHDSKEGGFFSAEDADSEVPVAAVYDRRPVEESSGAHTAPLQKKEGAFYVWTKKEIEDALGDDADIFNFHYGVQPHGTRPKEAILRTNFEAKTF